VEAQLHTFINSPLHTCGRGCVLTAKKLHVHFGYEYESAWTPQTVQTGWWSEKLLCSRRWDWRLSYLDVTPFSLENSVPTFRRNLLTPSSGQNSNIVRRGSRFSVMSIPTTNLLHDVAFQTTLIFRRKKKFLFLPPASSSTDDAACLSRVIYIWLYLLQMLLCACVHVRACGGGMGFGGTSSSAHFSNSNTNPPKHDMSQKWIYTCRDCIIRHKAVSYSYLNIQSAASMLRWHGLSSGWEIIIVIIFVTITVRHLRLPSQRLWGFQSCGL
jgi:hypothetical protein